MLRIFTTFLTLFAASQAGAVDAGLTSNNLKQVSFVEDTGDVQRISSAKSLRTYSQKIPAIACFLHLGINVSDNRALLEKARAGFDRKLSALRNGDADMGIIGGEERKKTLVRIDNVDAFWSMMNGAVDALISDSTDMSAVAQVKGSYIEFFELTDLLVTEVSGQYANPSVLDKSQAMRLNVVGRSATMTQKIAKNACMIAVYPEDDVFKERLSEAAGIYELSLTALLNGMPELGIQPAPTPEIADALVGLQSDWADMKYKIETLLSGEALSDDAKGELFKLVLKDMAKIDELVVAYEEYADYDY